MQRIALLRYRLLNTDLLLNRGLVYILLSISASAGYALLVSGLSLISGALLKPAEPLVVGSIVFLLALFLDPLRKRVQHSVDTVFFRSQVVYHSALDSFRLELTQVMELPAILLLLRRYANESLRPVHQHIFVHDPLSDLFTAAADENGRPTTDIRFSAGSPLIQMLSRARGAISLSDLNRLPSAMASEQARLALLETQFFIPLSGQQGIIGWLALSPRRSGEPYKNRDLSFLVSLCDQAALAVERAQVVMNLERRVREMNVLARVAQGTSFTVAFDDILELICAQTYQVIPTRDFRVTLYDKASEILTHAFYLENDERISAKENQSLPFGQGLESQVISGQRALLTDDYERECRSRGQLPVEPGFYSWMGVPLNAGAETIGVISLASRDPAVIFTAEQHNLFQAIADQASGAIVKARLLSEAEHRARQLAMLNEIARSLTSTLELKPLLNKILYSATEILNCLAGSLFLVDQATGELVFEVVISPVASDLTGRRLPPGKGLAGQAVITGQPIIANDAKRRKEWFEKTDLQTGFDTQDLLVVPMQLQERVIGVIEVINKRDGAPFNESDQEVLTTFSSQATIAIENARLYEMTDQALAARVEELSVMQRIDRELNASLDIDRAMRITLDWAMRQSGADAGLVGMVEGVTLRVMTSQGYPPEALAPQSGANGSQMTGQPSSVEIETSPGLKAAILTGQPQTLRLDEAQEKLSITSLLAGAHTQAVIPIRREANVIGVLLLESRAFESVAEDTLAFLSRLADHAAIAIANAQLYSEVQAANLAKSKFVSFVAHELKNPMASIKGYTELVAGGMAGPINDMQKSFLATVRSNTDRMNTIVSDLNDLTKIQVGQLRLEYRTVQVKDTLEEVVRSLQRQMEEKEQLLEINLPADLPAVWADPHRMAQILTNLVSNACKYTQARGKITIAAERSRADEGQPASLEVIHFWVQDSGIGIPEEDQKKIFQQYFRTDISKDTATGTGLGLNITKSLVEMQGGRIWFESQVGEGTTFHITIPVAEAQ